MAESFAYRSLIADGVIPQANLDVFTKRQLRTATQQVTLQSLEVSWPGAANPFAVSYLAVDRLLAAKGLLTIRDWCGRVGAGQEWHQACQFTDNFPAFENLGVPVLGISADDAKSHQAFRKKYNLRVRLLSDPDRSVHNAYGAWGERPGRGEGVIRSTFLVGTDGRVEKAWYFVKPDGHALEVLSALAACRSPPPR